jgi:hypothetical protein
VIEYITPFVDDWENPIDVIELDDGTLKVITNWDMEDYHNGKIPNSYLA